MDEKESRLRWWYAATFGFLACMAFFSALGPFFVRIFLVLSIFSFYPILRIWMAGKRSASSGRPFADDLFKKKPTQAPRRNLVSILFGESFLKKIKIIAWLGMSIVIVSFFVIPELVSNDEADEVQASLYQQRASAFYEQMQYDSAYINFKKAISLRPDYPEALFGYANTLYTRSYADSSIYYYDKAIALNSDYDDARYNKAWVYAQQQHYEKALETLEDLVSRNDGYAAAKQLKGDVYFSQHNYEEAKVWYENAYEQGFRDAAFCYRLGYVYDRLGDREKAIVLYKESTGYENAPTEVYKRLGELLPGSEGEVYRRQGV